MVSKRCAGCRLHRISQAGMDQDTLNLSIRKFLETVGVELTFDGEIALLTLNRCGLDVFVHPTPATRWATIATARCGWAARTR
jgi:hypothetical protein